MTVYEYLTNSQDNVDNKCGSEFNEANLHGSCNGEIVTVASDVNSLLDALVHVCREYNL